MNPKTLNILLADDDIDDRDFFKKALIELPIATKLSTVIDGVELMKLLTSDRFELPDILFLDINMPQKNGMECLFEIRQNEKLKDLPVVMFSTSNAWETINILFKTGVNIYIHKPSDFKQLKQVIFHAIPISTENGFSKTQVKYVLNA